MAVKVMSFAVEPVNLAEAASAFLAERDLAPTTRRVYALTPSRRQKALGSTFGVGDLDPNAAMGFPEAEYPAVSPATWNRNVATLKSFCTYCRRQGWMDVADPREPIKRRRMNIDETKAVLVEVLQAVWGRRDIPLREKAFWRLLYETAARAAEILNLDVEDVDLPNRKARVVSKGGAVEWVYFASGSARLLPRLIRDRKKGPLFVSSLRPGARAGEGRPRTSIPPPGGHVSPTARPRTLRPLLGRPYPPPASALHPPRRGRSTRAAAQGQEPAPLAPDLAALGPPWTGGGRRHDRSPRSRGPTIHQEARLMIVNQLAVIGAATADDGWTLRALVCLWRTVPRV